MYNQEKNLMLVICMARNLHVRCDLHVWSSGAVQASATPKNMASDEALATKASKPLSGVEALPQLG